MPVAAAQDEDSSQFPALNRLLTADQTILLNTIDKLRNHGVSKYVKLPQIIVCGDQSSGKSSVLEAISRIRFPRGEGVTTTFPTELALRRGPKRTVKVQLKPSASRPESEKILLARYQSPVAQLGEFDSLVNEAKEHLRRNAGNDRTADSFFEDTLHVEVTDPQWPPLSLVDLPGLISSPNPQQTEKDVEIVRDLVSKYMENPKCIILAIVSANYNFQRDVFSMIKKFDPLGKRTICVVTKPDIATPGPSDIPLFVQYAQNKHQGYFYELGWQVVMNGGPGGHNAQHQTWDDRDKAEKDFFNQSPWIGELHRDQLGISKLRDRLSTLLEIHTRAEMPGVLKQIKDMLNESREALSKLGPARYTSHDQRVHLTHISQSFEHLVRQATNGHYDDPSFFLPELPESDPRKLRAALQNLNENFARLMHERGHAKQIVNGLLGPPIWPSSVPPRSSFASTGSFQVTGTSLPQMVTRKDYIQHIKSLSRKNRGTELIGSPNFRLVRDLFLDQSRPWRALATEHLENILQVITAHLSAVSDNIASPETAATLRREIVYDAMDGRQKRVMEKLEELLKPHEKGHPVTYDLNYIQKSRNLIKTDVKDRLEKYQRQKLQIEHNDTTEGNPQPEPPQGLQIHQVISALKLDAEDIEEVDCTDILNSTQAYYEGALRTFIDNVAVLAVEGCLVDGLENVFSPIKVVAMDKEKLRALGGESEQAQAERLELEQKVSALQDAQRECLRAGAVQEHQSYETAARIRVTEQVTTSSIFSAPAVPTPSTTPAKSQSPVPAPKTTASFSFGAPKGAPFTPQGLPFERSTGSGLTASSGKFPFSFSSIPASNEAAGGDSTSHGIPPSSKRRVLSPISRASAGKNLVGSVSQHEPALGSKTLNRLQAPLPIPPSHNVLTSFEELRLLEKETARNAHRRLIMEDLSPRYSISPPSSHARLKKKVIWKGLKVLRIFIPMDDERGRPGKAPRPMRKPDIAIMHRNWQQLGYNITGFNLGSDHNSADVTANSRSKEIWPNPDDVRKDRFLRRYRVSIPDQSKRDKIGDQNSNFKIPCNLDCERW